MARLRDMFDNLVISESQKPNARRGDTAALRSTPLSRWGAQVTGELEHALGFAEDITGVVAMQTSALEAMGTVVKDLQAKVEKLLEADAVGVVAAQRFCADTEPHEGHAWSDGVEHYRCPGVLVPFVAKWVAVNGKTLERCQCFAVGEHEGHEWGTEYWCDGVA